MKKLGLLILAASLAGATWLAAQTLPALSPPPATQPAPATSPAPDRRFLLVHDKDHPWGFVPDFPDKAAWQQRADFLRHQVLVANGLWPMPVKAPLNPVFRRRIDRPDYTIDNVYFVSLPGHYVTGNLYRPKRPPAGFAKCPAVLVPYGHWPEGRFMWRSDADVQKEIAGGAEKSPEAARTPLQASCAMLAEMGCVAFQWDMVGYGDSKSIPHQQGFLDADAVLRLQSFMGLQTWNSIRALDFVASLPDVDPARIGVTGASSGGTQTIQLAAVDDRIVAAFPIVMVSMNMQGGCVCENAPLLRIGTNNVELASLFAPRAQGAAAAQDWTSDFETRGLPDMKSIYRLFGAADSVEGKFFPYPHNINLHSREMMYNFINRTFKLGLTEPVVEKPFIPVPPADLSVWDNKNPGPPDRTDAVGVRRYMTNMAAAQLSLMPPQDYDDTLRVALRVMTNDQLPEPADIEHLSDPTSNSKGGIWRGTIGRKGAGERVPTVCRNPGNWNGTVVVWADPRGVSSVLGPGDAPVREVQTLLDGRALVIAVDPFMGRSFHPATSAPSQPATTRRSSNPPYSAYHNGYERTILANRVHDLLTAIALARSLPDVKSVRLGGLGEGAVAALLADAVAGKVISRTALDLNGFDFDRIKDDTDPMLLPGALKYDGVLGFLSLCAGRPTLVIHAPTPRTPRYLRTSKLPGITISARTPDQLAAWLAQP